MQEIAIIEKEWVKWVEQGKGLKITNQQEYTVMASSVKLALNFKARIEAFYDPTINRFKKTKAEAEIGRKETIDAMNQHISHINIFVTEVRQKCKDYENKQEKIRLADEKKAQEEAEKKAKISEEFAEAQGLNDPEEPPTPPPVVKVKSNLEKATGIGIRRTWKYRITNETLIPSMYFKLDHVKLGDTIREYKDTINIPGIEVYYD